MKVTVLREGKYKELEDGMYDVDCSVTLIEFGKFNILFDTGGAWALSHLLDSLAAVDLAAADITHVIASHGHSDHNGGLSAFPDAFHILGGDANLRSSYTTICSTPASVGIDTVRFFHDEFFTGGKIHPWGEHSPPLNDPRGADGSIRLVTTPGHTGHCSSLLLEAPLGIDFESTEHLTRIAVVGDLWDCQDDDDYFRTISEQPQIQEESRAFVLKWSPQRIIPGHGPPFSPQN
ncbi:unnamed protein product [Aphanomyces euteiches]|uniref:Metallo-beta-lactamase domain-containing protein 1 n=1 Tax=Aphanomyces euteiches TaxID=100861 RepID=A0A6G0WUF9_9STRA|nr:hypothetical protein Ae201684_011674 [Aphanomyces euteiches]KAH9096960.1 hypothetical protein Ae201684P_011693 [Aphanomyces euteiches]KAH9156564.1 hypothetical protein AeRB84_001552 [Aphanomyces euteiches]